MSKTLTPGNFEDVKHGGNLATVLRNVNYETLVNDIVKPNMAVSNDRNTNIKNATNILKNMSVKQLKDLTNKYQRQVNPLSLETQVYYQQQNMTGLDLVGMFANQSVNHAIVQNTDLAISPNWAIQFNGNKTTSLNAIKSYSGEFISTLITTYSASAVDNVKDPQLSNMNISTLTANIAGILAKMGVNKDTTSLFLNQPIIHSIIERATSSEYIYDTFESNINAILEEYSKFKAKSKIVTSFNFTDDFFVSELIDPKPENQALVGYLFSHLNELSTEFALMVASTRSDTQGAAAQPTYAATQDKDNRIIDFMFKAEDNEDTFKLIDALRPSSTNKNEYPELDTFNSLLKKYQNRTTKRYMKSIDLLEDAIKLENAGAYRTVYNELSSYYADTMPPLIHANIINARETSNNINDIRSFIRNSKMPMPQAFYTCGVRGAITLADKIFPYKYMDELVDELAGYTKNGKLSAIQKNHIYETYIGYILMDNVLFTEEEKLKMLRDFPKQFNNLKVLASRKEEYS